MSILKVILADPAHWLWDTETQVELFRLLPKLWPTLDDDERTRLIGSIEAGPPKEMFANEIDEAEWNELRDQMIWSRLGRIATQAPPLPEGTRTLLAQIEERHPAWKLSGESREDFPTWIEVRWGVPSRYTPETLAALSDDELIKLLLTEKRNREGLIDRWSTVVSSDVGRSIGLLERLVAEEEFQRDVWSGALRGLRSTGGKAAIRERLIGLFKKLPDNLLKDVIHGLADLMKEIADEVPDGMRADILGAWDRLLPISLGVDIEIDADRVTAAINHPIGTLTEALFGILRSRELKRDEGVEEDIRVRLERILSDPSNSGRLGRVIIASRLPLLYDLSQQWTREKLIDRFDWQHEEEATGTWQGFLWSPVIRPSLWVVLKPHFLNTFDHLDAIQEGQRSLPTLLASIAIDGGDALTPTEARECLRKLDDSGRSTVAWWLERKLEDAGKQAGILWKERIGPWLTVAWPKEPALRSDATSTHLAGTAVFAREAFPEAVTAIVDLLGSITRAWGLLKRLREYGYATSHPVKALELVDRVTPGDPPYWFGNLRRFLDLTQQADATLSETPRFKRLNEIAITKGLNQGDDDDE